MERQDSEVYKEIREEIARLVWNDEKVLANKWNREIVEKILALFPIEEAMNEGARQMASQIRKAIEAGSGVFADHIENWLVVESDANWIVKKFRELPSLDGIVVEEKCNHVPHIIQEGSRDHVMIYETNGMHCSTKDCERNCKCHGTGAITKTAEWVDFDNAKIIRWIKAFMIISDQGNIELLEGEDLLLHLQNLANDALTTKSGGQLMVKE